VGFNLLVWSTVELQLGIICACAPSLRAFFRRYLSTMFSRPSINTGGQSTTGNSRSNDRRHGAVDSHQNDSKTPHSKNRDIVYDNNTTTSIDMQNLTRSSLQHPRPRGESPYPKPLEAYNRTDPVPWHSNSTLGAAPAEEATRWYSNSTNGDGETQRVAEPLRRQDSVPRGGGHWPLSPESEASGGILMRAQSVRSAV